MSKPSFLAGASVALIALVGLASAGCGSSAGQSTQQPNSSAAQGGQPDATSSSGSAQSPSTDAASDGGSSGSGSGSGDGSTTASNSAPADAPPAASNNPAASTSSSQSGGSSESPSVSESDSGSNSNSGSGTASASASDSESNQPFGSFDDLSGDFDDYEDPDSICAEFSEYEVITKAREMIGPMEPQLERIFPDLAAPERAEAHRQRGGLTPIQSLAFGYVACDVEVGEVERLLDDGELGRQYRELVHGFKRDSYSDFIAHYQSQPCLAGASGLDLGLRMNHDVYRLSNAVTISALILYQPAADEIEAVAELLLSDLFGLFDDLSDIGDLDELERSQIEIKDSESCSHYMAEQGTESSSPPAERPESRIES